MPKIKDIYLREVIFQNILEIFLKSDFSILNKDFFLNLISVVEYYCQYLIQQINMRQEISSLIKAKFNFEFIYKIWNH